MLAPLRGGHARYAFLVELASLQIDDLGLAEGAGTRDRIEAVEAKFQAYVRAHPSVPEARAQLGSLQTMLGKHQDAIASLTAALKSPMDLSGLYRNLTISYAALGRYDEAMQTADQAVELGPDMFVDPQFIYAAARASASVGKIDAAVTALNVLATKRPELQKDPEFWDAARFVKEKKAAAAKR